MKIRIKLGIGRVGLDLYKDNTFYVSILTFLIERKKFREWKKKIKRIHESTIKHRTNQRRTP